MDTTPRTSEKAQPFPARALTGRMHCVCMDCGDRYGQVRCIALNDGHETHGVCPACVPARMAEIEALAPAAKFESERRVFVPRTEVTEICGLPVARLEALQPHEWRSGVDYISRGEAINWRRLSLPALVGMLATRGEIVAAGKLLRWLTGDKTAECANGRCIVTAAVGGAAAPKAERLSWAAEWERRHEA